MAFAFANGFCISEWGWAFANGGRHLGAAFLTLRSVTRSPSRSVHGDFVPVREAIVAVVARGMMEPHRGGAEIWKGLPSEDSRTGKGEDLKA
jgi:hypothetical protein